MLCFTPLSPRPIADPGTTQHRPNRISLTFKNLKSIQIMTLATFPGIELIQLMTHVVFPWINSIIFMTQRKAYAYNSTQDSTLS